MACSLVLLLLSSVSILYVNGHVSEADKIHQNNLRPIAENELRHQNEILWMDQLAPISLHVKSEAQVQPGKTHKLYRKVRAPPKMMDRQVRKKSGIFHKSFKRGLSRADKQMRKGLLLSHDLVRQGVITFDRQSSRGLKRAHDSIRRSSSWLDDKLVAGSRSTHRSVKRGLKPVDKGLAVGSVRAYSTVKKGVTTVDRGLKNGARALDKQLTSGKIKKVPVTLFLNKFISKKGKKSKPVAALPPASEPELKESEVPEEFKDAHFAPFEIEGDATPSEGKHSEELVNFEGGHTDGHEERAENGNEEKHEEKAPEHKEEAHEHADEIKNEEPADFDMADFDDFDDAKHEDHGHDHGQSDHDHLEHDHFDHDELDNDNFDHGDHHESPTADNEHHDPAFDGGPRSVQKSGKKRYFNLGKFDSRTLKQLASRNLGKFDSRTLKQLAPRNLGKFDSRTLTQFAPRSSIKAPKSLQRSLAKVSKPLALSSKYNLRSLPKKSKSLWNRSNKQKSEDSRTV